MPPFQQTGLTMLGEAISGGARDYATRKLALEDEARRRGYQLSDIQSARDYETQSYKNRLQLQNQMEIAAGLIHEGLLSPQDVNNAEAVQRAFEEGRRRGLDKLYSDLLTMPGPDGKPLLDRSMMSDPAAIERAKAAYAQIQAKSNALKLEQPGNASASIDALTTEASQVRQQLSAVEQRLAAPQPAPDPTVITNRALQMATEANGGKPPSRQQIDAMVPQATQEAGQQALQRWYQDKEDSKVQYQLLNARLNNIRQQQSDLTRTFGVAPRASSLVEPAAPPVAARSVEASPEQRQQALTAAIRAATGGNGAPPPAPAATAPGTAPLLQNPTQEPLIAAENTRITQGNLSAQNRALADPYNEALDNLQSVNQQIADVRAGKPLVLMGGGDSPATNRLTVERDPSMQAHQLSDLLIKQQAVQRDLETKRRLMLGLPAAVTAPTVSTPNSSVPAAYSKPADWWMGN